MLEAKVIFFTDNESYNWFEQFFFLTQNSNVLTLPVMGRTGKIEKKKAVRERRKTTEAKPE